MDLRSMQLIAIAVNQVGSMFEHCHNGIYNAVSECSRLVFILYI